MNADPDTYDNTPTLTAAETAAIEQGNADDAAARVEAAPAATVPEVETPAAPDAVALALAENTAAIRALTENQLAAATASAAAPEVVAPPPRDFEAEHAALAERFDSGDLNAVELAAEARKLTLQESAIQNAALLEADRAAQLAVAHRQAEEQAEVAWRSATDTFFADPGNAAIVDNEIKFAGFNAAVQVAFKEGLADNAAILARARQLVTGLAPVDQAAALRQATFDRNRDAGAQAPTTLRDVPNTAPIGDTPGGALDSLDISTLEDKLFLMSDADRNRFLESAPGGLLDNPRATA